MDDIKNLNDTVTEKQVSLKKYQEELQKELEKANSRDVKVILDFLKMWKLNMKDFYHEALQKWIETRKAYIEADRKYYEESNWATWTGNETKLAELKQIRKNAKESFNQWKFLNPYLILFFCKS